MGAVSGRRLAAEGFSPPADLQVAAEREGGHSGWDNIVTCCAPCNRRKGDHLPKSVGMHPKRKPKEPTSTIFIHVATPVIPQAWEQYLVAA